MYVGKPLHAQIRMKEHIRSKVRLSTTVIASWMNSKLYLVIDLFANCPLLWWIQLLWPLVIQSGFSCPETHSKVVMMEQQSRSHSYIERRNSYREGSEAKITIHNVCECRVRGAQVAWMSVAKTFNSNHHSHASNRKRGATWWPRLTFPVL